VQYKLLSQYYLEEAIWVNQNYELSFHDNVRVSAISCGLPMLVPVVMLGLSGDSAPTTEEFEWVVVDPMPDMVIASGQVGRFLSDMAAYRLGKNKDPAIAGMAEQAWRTVNKGCMLDPAATGRRLSAVQVTILDMTRSMEIIYLGGKRDDFTFRTTLKEPRHLALPQPHLLGLSFDPQEAQ
jgi:eudesmane-5,11-diol synthase